MESKIRSVNDPRYWPAPTYPSWRPVCRARAKEMSCISSRAGMACSRRLLMRGRLMLVPGYGGYTTRGSRKKTLSKVLTK